MRWTLISHKVAVVQSRWEREEPKIDLARCQIAKKSFQNRTRRVPSIAQIRLLGNPEVDRDKNILAGLALEKVCGDPAWLRLPGKVMPKTSVTDCCCKCIDLCWCHDICTYRVDQRASISLFGYRGKCKAGLS